MKKRPEDDLLSDVFDGGDSRRSKSLEHLLSTVRQRRRTRQGINTAGMIAIALGLFYLVYFTPQNPSQQPTSLTKTSHPPSVAANPEKVNVVTIPGTEIRVVSDEELFAMFPNQPIALINSPGDEPEIVFLNQ